MSVTSKNGRGPRQDHALADEAREGEGERERDRQRESERERERERWEHGTQSIAGGYVTESIHTSTFVHANTDAGGLDARGC